MNKLFSTIFVCFCLLSDTSITNASELPGFRKGEYFDEQVTDFNISPEVRIHINAPSSLKFDPARKTKLIIYALPNGNTIEQTEGKQIQPGDDWHYDIQHITAQTRFLREHLPEKNIVIAYLETAGKSWPAWRRKYSDNPVIIKSIVDSLRNIFIQYDPSIILSSHSGGGSFIFGFINSVESIPYYIERIGFLDSNYAYEDSLKHGDKIIRWLKSSKTKYLSILAYNDSVVIFNGKPLVSPTGGTWYRSKLMKACFEKSFIFSGLSETDIMVYSALDNRIKIYLKNNPKAEVLHTVQVEKNGFIHSILSGTSFEEIDYKYFGERAYMKWIR